MSQAGNPQKRVAFFVFLKRVAAVVFSALCLLHYFSQRPLWLDEGFVLNNLQGLSFLEIFGPLRNAQGFPPAVSLFDQDPGRVFSLACSGLAVFALVEHERGLLCLEENFRERF